MNKGSKLKSFNIGSKIRRYENKQKNAEFLKQESQKVTEAQDKSFLANGRHKVQTTFGLKIFDTLANLRRQKKSEVKHRNLDFQKGVTYTYEMFPQFSSDVPKIEYNVNKHQRPFSRNITIKVQNSFLAKIHQACSGGTAEKKLYMKSKTGRIANNLENDSDDDFDMFDGENKEEEDGMSMEDVKIDRGNARGKDNEEFRQQLQSDIALQKKIENGLKDEMKDFRVNLNEGGAIESTVDGYYQECFPKYEENEFQESIKDNNLHKRGQDNQNRLNGQVLKRLKTGSENF